MVGVRTVILSLAVAAAHPASAFVLGGGIADKDCRVAFGGVDPTEGASQVLCTDGDACDGDGVVDGSCRFAVTLCTGVAIAGCAPGRVTALDVAGVPLAEPPLPSIDGMCGTASDITLSAAGGETAISVIARDAGALKDVDLLNLCCRAAPTPFDGALCALAALPDFACAPGVVPARKLVPFTRARELVSKAAGEPAQARMLVRKATRELKKVKRTAKRLSRTNQCGFTMGLVVSHALETVRALLAR